MTDTFRAVYSEVDYDGNETNNTELNRPCEELAGGGAALRNGRNALDIGKSVPAKRSWVDVSKRLE